MIDLEKLRKSKGYVLAIVNTKTGEYEPVYRDVIEVSRCKDCNYFKSKLKTHYGFCACHFMEVIDNDYCSAAERKEDGD